jgi:hypothetical protein
MFLCHACSYHEIDDGNAGTGGLLSPGGGCPLSGATLGLALHRELLRLGEAERAVDRLEQLRWAMGGGGGGGAAPYQLSSAMTHSLHELLARPDGASSAWPCQLLLPPRHQHPEESECLEGLYAVLWRSLGRPHNTNIHGRLQVLRVAAGGWAG